MVRRYSSASRHARLSAAGVATIAILITVGVVHAQSAASQAAGATFEVVYRDTDQPDWTSFVPVGNATTAVLPLSKDNVIFGVRSVDAAGHRSAAVYPIPPPRTRPVPGTTASN